MTRTTVPCITINTDASWNHQHKIGGYAFVIVCDAFRIQQAGVLKAKPRSSIDAELMAIANALHVLAKQPNLPYTNLLILNSDCLAAFNLMKGKGKNKVAKVAVAKRQALRRAVRPPLGKFPKFDTRHVKAHTTVDDKRSHVNRWCDANAKKWMRHAVGMLKASNNPE